MTPQARSSARAASHLRSVADAAKLLDIEGSLNEADFSVQSRFFEVQGRLRVEHNVVNERSLVQRNGSLVTTLWRERAPGELLQ